MWSVEIRQLKLCVYFLDRMYSQKDGNGKFGKAFLTLRSAYSKGESFYSECRNVLKLNRRLRLASNEEDIAP